MFGFTIVLYAMICSVSAECNCPNPEFVSNVDMKADNLIEKIMGVFNNVYHRGNDILRSLEFQVQDSEQDHLNVDQREHCFMAMLDDAVIAVKNSTGEEALIQTDLTIKATVSEDRATTSICNCVQHDSTGVDFCQALLPAAIEKRLKKVKCMVESNCK